MFKSGPKYEKIKVNLRLCINRLKLLEKKKTEQALKSRKEIADYILNGKEDRARIRVEHIIREDYYVEAMEILELYCDLLLARFGLIELQSTMDPGLEEAISTLIWATPRVQGDVQEFKVISEQFTAKYGKVYADSVRSNSSRVNEKVIHRLGVSAPPRSLIENYMIEIARNYKVPFEPDPTVMKEDEIYLAENMLINLNEDKKNDTGGGGGGTGVGWTVSPQNPVDPSTPFAYPMPNQASGASGGGPPPIASHAPVGPGHAPVFTQPPAPNYNQLYMGQTNGTPYPQAGPLPSKTQASDTLPDFPELPSVPDSATPSGKSAGGEDVDFDDLTKRFEELKKKK